MTPFQRTSARGFLLLLVPLALLLALVPAVPALQAAPTMDATSWRDDFDDDTGLPQRTGVQVTEGRLSLVLHSAEWVQTSQADFQAGTLTDLDATSNPGTLHLASLPFAANKPLTAQGTEASWQYQPAVAVGQDGTIYLLWHDSQKSYGVYASRSADRGATWTVASHVSWDGEPLNPLMVEGIRVAVDASGVLHAVWADNRPSRDGDSDLDIFYARSTDRGATWSANVRLNKDTGDAAQREPALAVSADGSSVYVVWTDGRNTLSVPEAPDDWDIYSVHSTDGGLTWKRNVRVDDGPSGTAQTQPTLAVDAGGTLYAAWRDTRGAAGSPPDPADIRMAVSTDGGFQWSASTKVNTESFAPQQQSQPALVAFEASPARLAAAWGEGGTESYPLRIAGASSSDSGSTWGSAVILDGEGGYGFRTTPSLGLSESGTVLAVWTRYRSGYTDPDVLMARSFDGGVHWTSPQVVSLHEGADQGFPSLGVARDAHAVIAFQERAGGDVGVYVAPDPGLPGSGTFLSPVWDTRGMAAWGAIQWDAQVPGASSLALRTRTGNTPNPADGTWSAWSPPYVASGSTVSSPAARYVQVRATFTRGGNLVSPILDEIRLRYSQYRVGQAVSVLIQPPVLGRWELLLYSADEPPGTALRVDILDARGTALFSDVPSGFDLSLVNPVQYPTLRLRARLESTGGSASPSLDSWQVHWSLPPTETPTPTATATATASATPTVTLTPGGPPTATPTATASPTPTSTATATPTVSWGRAYLPLVVRLFP